MKGEGELARQIMRKMFWGKNIWEGERAWLIGRNMSLCDWNVEGMGGVVWSEPGVHRGRVMQRLMGFAKAFALDSNRNGMLSEFWWRRATVRCPFWNGCPSSCLLGTGLEEGGCGSWETISSLSQKPTREMMVAWAKIVTVGMEGGGVVWCLLGRIVTSWWLTGCEMEKREVAKCVW